MVPLSTALAGTGAAGWASGSQTWTPTRPALIASPNTNRPTVPSPRPMSAVRLRDEGPGVVGDQDQRREQRELADQRHHQIDLPRPQGRCSPL